MQPSLGDLSFLRGRQNSHMPRLPAGYLVQRLVIERNRTLIIRSGSAVEHNLKLTKNTHNNPTQPNVQLLNASRYAPRTKSNWICLISSIGSIINLNEIKMFDFVRSFGEPSRTIGVRFCSFSKPNLTIGDLLSSIGFSFDFTRLDTPGG